MQSLDRPPLRKAHGPSEPDDQGTGEEVRKEPDDIVQGVEANLIARLDEEIRTGGVAGDGDGHGGCRAAHPHGRGDGAEHRDQRQRVAHERVEQPAQRQRPAKGGE